MIGRAFTKLYKAYGDQHWWHADSTFEIMVGAILVQNTSWSNVELAIKQLKQHSALTPSAIVTTSDEQLAEWIRSSGFFNVKTQRLKNFTQWYLDQGGFAALDPLDTPDLREMLLLVKGIGKETADDILLYAFERSVFVIDAYTRRFFYRLGLINGDEPYDELQHLIELSLDRDVGLFNEYHALIVRHGKERCRKEPLCDGCPLDAICVNN
ncbi:MAG: endonuclease III domain-containing protein [Thiotrichaceae bacterium]